MATTTAVVSKSIALANIVKHRHYELREAVERAKLNEKVGNDDESGGSGRGGGSAGKACTADTAAAAAADTAATTDRDVWNQHLHDDAGLAKYAEAMHELATKEWTEAGRGRIVWCLETADAYFLNGGRQTASAKDARRALFAAARAAAAAAAATASAPAAALPGTASGPASPSAGGGGSSGSAGNAGVVRELPPTKRRKTDGSDDNGKEIEVEEEVVPNILHVLDVGSCYNPFGAAARATLGLDPKLKALSAALNVLPIDIAPALQTAVYKADILSIPIIDTPTPPASPSHAVDGGAASASAGTVPAVTPATFSEDGKELVLLQRSKFDIVIFCLLLSYLPTPALRLECCKQARKALKLSGLLLIITPDSNHVGKGAKRMKNWKVAIESLGFRRCKYEKLQHAHCLAFRAVELPSTSAHGAASGGLGSSPPPDYSGFLEIPQDK